MRADDKDARGFRDGADAVEGLLDADLPVVVQHAPARGGMKGRCGSFGQLAPMGIGVTCPDCKVLMAKRGRR